MRLMRAVAGSAVAIGASLVVACQDATGPDAVESAKARSVAVLEASTFEYPAAAGGAECWVTFPAWADAYQIKRRPFTCGTVLADFRPGTDGAEARQAIQRVGATMLDFHGASDGGAWAGVSVRVGEERAVLLALLRLELTRGAQPNFIIILGP